jgi:mono/diheme cytochrome c family protein
MTARILILLCLVFCTSIFGGSAAGDSIGRGDYLADCARCHGVDGKGRVPAMSAVPGYISVDLTQLSRNNNGVFPHQEVYDAIDGRKRFPAHLIGDMPTWGLKYAQRSSTDSEHKVRSKISALVAYIESIQEN